MKKSYKKYFGFLCLALAQLAVAVNFINGKEIAGIVPGYVFVCCRFIIGTFLILLVKILLKDSFYKEEYKEIGLTKKEWFLLTLQALLGGLIFNYLLILGLVYTSATSAGMVASTFPVVLTLYSYFFLKEKLNANKCFSILLCVIGMLFLSYGSFVHINSTDILGMLIIFLAMTPEAWYSIIAKLLVNKITPIGSGLFTNFINGFLTLPIVIRYFATSYEVGEWSLYIWSILGIGGFTSLVFFVCWIKGLEYTSTITASIFAGLMPVFTSILGVLYLYEDFTFYHASGMFFVLSSIIIGAGDLTVLKNFLNRRFKVK